MKRIILWLAATLSVLVLLFGYRTSTSGALNTTQTPVTGTSPQTSSHSSGSGPGSGSSASGSASSGSGSGGSGGSGGGGTGANQSATQTFTGNAVATQWGPVQVQVTTKNGSISSVSVIQYPHTNSYDQQVNGYALPILVKETLNAQSARIDMVSGATLTSGGYLQSLQSALDQAGA